MPLSPKSSAKPPSSPKPPKELKYAPVIERIFSDKFAPGESEVEFHRTEFKAIADELGIELASNPGDLVYTFKFRRTLPSSILATERDGLEWRVESIGGSWYRLLLAPPFPVSPDTTLAEIKIPDATPGIITKHAFKDEQALLAKLRYNRLVDIFTGVTCYSLENHLRTSVMMKKGRSQIEIDELYIGVDKRGAQYVFPVQAKGGSDSVAIQQLHQDLLFCQQKLPHLVCRPVAAQFMQDGKIALFLFEDDAGLRKIAERHYQLVQADNVTAEDLEKYRNRPGDEVS